MRLLKKSLIIAATALCSFSAFADLTSYKQQLTERFDGDQPGGAFAIYQNGEIIDQHYFGMANIEAEQAFGPNTQINVASITKHFTSFAILMLEAEGKLSIDDTLEAYFPELVRAEDITIEQLMLHSSGLRSDLALYFLQGYLSYHEDITTEDMLAVIMQQTTLNFEPGTEYSYSNAGYTLLADIVEQVSDTTYEQWLAENVFEPLEMNDTGFIVNDGSELPNRALAYQVNHLSGTAYAADTGINTANGSGGLHITMGDFGKWLNNFATKTVGEQALEKLLAFPESASPDNRYGYGLGFSNTPDKLSIISHAGLESSHNSLFMYQPDSKMGLLVNVNALPNANAETIAATLRDYLMASTPAQLEALPEVNSDPIELENLEQFAGIYSYAHPYMAAKGWVELTIKNDQLSFANGSSSLTLTPTSQVERGRAVFTVAGLHQPVAFRVSPTKGARRFDIDLGFGKTTHRRQTELESIDAGLNGSFASPDLGTYKLAVNSNKTTLNFTYPNGRKTRGIVQRGELLLEDGWYLEVIRNSDGEVTGLEVISDRVNGIVLSKQGKE